MKEDNLADSVLSNDYLLQLRHLALQNRPKIFASTAEIDTEGYTVRFGGHRFLENVVDECREDALKVPLAFEDIVDGMKCFCACMRLDGTEVKSGKGKRPAFPLTA